MPKSSVISPRGRIDTCVVAFMRVAVSLSTGAILVSIVHYIAGDSGWMFSLVAMLFAGCASFFEIWYGGMAARREERTMRRRLLQAVFVSSSSRDDEFSEFSSGNLVALHTDNVERVAEYRQAYFGSAMAAMLIPFIVLFYFSISIDLLLGITIILLCFLIPIFLFLFMKFFRKTSAHSRRERAALADRYLDAIRNLETIRLFGAGARIEVQLREQRERNRGAVMRLLAGNQLVIVVVDGLFSLVLICCTAALTIARFRAGAIDLPDALTTMFLTVLLIEPLTQVAGFFYVGMGGLASQKAIAAYLASRGSIASHGGLPSGSREGSIVVDSLSFDYGRGAVFTNVGLTVRQGTKAAIIGRSGAGKTTLLEVINGTLPVQTGSVRIAGRSIEGLSPVQTRSLTAKVSQRTWLFTGSIADNLRVAKPEATDDEMWQALRRAYVADEFAAIGLHADIGEQGGLISGGQAQRISLARAFLSGRKILLLDEPTSQVDIESEARIIEAIESLGSEWTLLVVTHRRAILRVVDEIWRLSDGVLERGDRP